MALNWQKSSFSSGDVQTNCVEIATGLACLHLRESDDPGASLSPDVTAFRALLTHLKGTHVR